MEHIKAFLGGSGADAFNEPLVVDRLLQLVPATQTANGRAIQVAYLGTATYDLPDAQEKQTGQLARRGCHVRPIRVSDPAVTQLSRDDDTYLCAQADIILVSGGNTLYAVQRWERVGLDRLLRRVATQRGGDDGRGQVILAGGSAGAICWFTAGHSRSFDPTTFREAMLKTASAMRADAPSSAETAAATPPKDEGSWCYIRVHGLDILPGLLCPHFDIAQGDRSVRREEDFTAMLQRHPTERGIALDHWAVLILPGDGSYEVLPVPGHTRQQQAAQQNAELTGKLAPGLFVLDAAVDGSVQQRRVAATGRVRDVLRAPTGPVAADTLEAECAKANPAC
ncbi:putative cyclin 1 putativeserine peptidase family S51 peptidase E [Leptomonas pyrrhocoris]|uniref:Putative cyclin 1 putativeserine peptidase family S51 peptidase E n=1 Tax=Leptomonas pyrrhocoris TaxID=157538 RepID=A0A0M9FQL2_LEPPY|nr:putative cyclin 1 putativeserine peptidase family S51 peptidase E [Leptomonas pyrrhocoris]KPA73909.1 putative cyclin 1 putativeserine peptidase family S51 peptidase E [Leptomonas pyrrhocoris]|eukprot:XP_015652348.1 putative cyclin 1 putativeserine peptidase family S51 peptidase E [Leptomonas pyrrhocoris]